MNILHICNNYISSSVHQKMVQGSRKIGVKNTVFAPVVTLEGRVTPGEDEYAVDCVNSFDRYFFYHKQRKTFSSLLRTVDVTQRDLVHTHCVFTDGNAALRLKKEYGIPYLVTVNNTDLNHFFRLRVFLRSRGLRIMREAAAIIFIAASYQDALYGKYVPKRLRESFEKKTYVIPFGIDQYWFENKAEEPKSLGEDGEIRVFYAGDVNANKNIGLTIAAIKRLRNEGRNITFFFAGKVHDQRLHQQIMSESFVTYLGLLDKEGLLEQYRKADIFAMPSHRDTFGLVYAEAMSQGTPILYTHGQGFDEQFPDGRVGYAVSDTDPEEMADRMEKIIENYETLSSNCLQDVEKFNWDRIVEKYKDVYDRILKED